MSKNSSSSSPGFSQMLSTAVKTIQANIHAHTQLLKKSAKVPRIKVKNGENGKVKDYPLIGDRQLIIGSSSRFCDVVLRNPYVSRIHCLIERHPQHPNIFMVKDQNSTNGVYLGTQRYNSLPLRHGEMITLGPPELRDVIEISLDYAPALWVLIIRYILYLSALALLLLIIAIGTKTAQYQVYPLPEGVAGPIIIYSDDEKTSLRLQVASTHRELEKLSDFSPYLPKAVIASEDSRYYWHFGVDPWGVLRALIVNYRQDGVKQGASTITQQVARSIFPAVGREDTVERKLRELLVALKLEFIYSKNEIIKTYLNRVYLGGNNYGFEDAAQFYFGKSAANLEINEAATLVAILPAPNSYNPVQNYSAAVSFRNRVLDRMYKLGMITKDQYSDARRSRIEISPKARQNFSSIIAPYFYDYIFTELSDLLGEDLAKEGDFIVETRLNKDKQKKAEIALQEYLKSYGSQYGFSQGAIATLDTQTGEILALVGGKDYNESQFNRATQAQRQPGSTFKVFAYTAALKNGISPYKTYSCTSLYWQGITYKPCERSSGSINMFQGIAQSENAIALRVAKEIGLSAVIDMAQELGIKSELRKVPGLVLGQSESNVLEMTGAYATFDNQGTWNRAHGIIKIRDGRDCQNYQHYNTCRLIYEFNQDGNETKKVISPEIAETMTKMMQGVIKSGTGKNAYIGKNEAGKTGTTNEGVDLWFIGYIPSEHLVTGIWLGNDDNSPTKSSSTQAASLWRKYMLSIN